MVEGGDGNDLNADGPAPECALCACGACAGASDANCILFFSLLYGDSMYYVLYNYI